MHLHAMHNAMVQVNVMHQQCDVLGLTAMQNNIEKGSLQEVLKLGAALMT
jgi:hypothetical protein